jgi:hypothetical protein
MVKEKISREQWKQETDFTYHQLLLRFLPVLLFKPEDGGTMPPCKFWALSKLNGITTQRIPLYSQYCGNLKYNTDYINYSTTTYFYSCCVPLI